MTQSELDCLIVPPAMNLAARTTPEARYLSHVGGAEVPAAVVFSADRITAFVEDVEFWARAQPWCDDLRPLAINPGGAVAACLAELNLPLHRIGLVGLDAPDPWSPPAGFVRSLQRAHPGIEWTDPGPDLRHLRAQKSREEIAYLRRSVQVLERAVAALALPAGARLGDVESILWRHICAEGSETPPRPTVHVSPVGASGSISGDVMPKQATLVVTATAAWGGYQASLTDTIRVGAPTAAEREAFEALVRTWEQVRVSIKTNSTLTSLLDVARRGLRAALPRKRSGLSLELHGAGLGNDEPSIASQQLEPAARIRIPSGSCFELRVAFEQGEHLLAWGDTLVLRRGKAERLGRRPLAMQVLPRSG